jgi:hypothetical protein
MNNPDWELRNNFLGFLMRIRDGKNSAPGSGIEKFGSGINIPDPQHCNKILFLCVHILLNRIRNTTQHTVLFNWSLLDVCVISPPGADKDGHRQKNHHCHHRTRNSSWNLKKKLICNKSTHSDAQKRPLTGKTIHKFQVFCHFFTIKNSLR